jgi:hypothetical protein
MASETVVNDDRVAMATAALLHFNGSVADLLCDGLEDPMLVPTKITMQSLTPSGPQAGVDPPVVAELRRIFLSGILASCHAISNEANFKAFYHYGNHSTMSDDPEKAYGAMVKDNRKGFTLLFDRRAVLFMLHCHLTPQGLVDVDTPYKKKPRPIFDSSF